MSEDISEMCKQCGAKCCRYFCFQIDQPNGFEEFDDLRWFLMHEGISIHIDDGDWYISIPNPCKSLTEDGQCAAYENRPLICRKYSHGNCDFTGGDYGYTEEFRSAEDIEEYAMKTLGKKAYRKARDKAYAKAARKEARQARKKAMGSKQAEPES